jgi:predicted rRNA methylase YqxC with S4 and FtsJ domains
MNSIDEQHSKNTDLEISRHGKRADPAFLDSITLDNQHLQNCKVVSKRLEIIKLFPKDLICAEIGVMEGGFSEEILQVNNPSEFYLIESNTKGENLCDDLRIKFSENENVIVKEGYSWDVLRTFDDNYFDWVFIDADHTYVSTKLELEISKDKVKDNGYIACHDYSNKNKNESLTDYGVIQSVNEFCLQYDYEVVYLSLEPDQNHTIVLKKMKE